MTLEDKEQGSIVFHQGDEGTTFYVILGGSVDVNVRDVVAGTSFTATQLFLGDSFGELALVNNAVRGATIVCCEDCSFLRIEKSDYERILLAVQQVELEERAEFLSTITLFHTWTRASLKGLAQVMATKSVDRNTVIIRQGDEPDGLYFVRKGTCRVLKQVSFGRSEDVEQPPRHKPPPPRPPPLRVGNPQGILDGKVPSAKGKGKGKGKDKPAPEEIQREVADEHDPDSSAPLIVDNRVIKLLEIGTLGPREFFGEVALVLSTTRLASVVSVTPVELLVLSKNDFVRKITGKTFDVMRDAIDAYQTDDDLRKKYLEGVKWEKYKVQQVNKLLKEKEQRERVLKPWKSKS
jgi:CRP-like cAMP-binding protein